MVFGLTVGWIQKKIVFFLVRGKVPTLPTEKIAWELP